MMLGRHIRGCLILGWIAIVFSTTGCASISDFYTSMTTPVQRAVAPAWQSVVISTAADVNLSSPIAVDIVFVTKPELLKNVQDLTSAKWFAGRESAVNSFSDGLKVISFELVPDQVVVLSNKELAKFSALQVFVFANYQTPGDHKSLMVLEEKGYSIKLEARAFKLNSFSSNTKP